MADRIRPRDTQPKLVGPPEFDTCNLYVEAVSPAFDPKRVLLRCVFFIVEDRIKYVSVGFFLARDYQPLVEFGAVKRNKPAILVLTDQHMKTMAEIRPRVCESMCGNEQYGFKDGDFRLNTTGSYRVARFYLHKQCISLKLVELQHLSRMFHVVQNELDLCTLALPYRRTIFDHLYRTCT